MRKWLAGMAVIGLVFDLSLVFAQEGNIHEAAVLISDDQLIPGEIYVPKGKDLRLNVLNIRKNQGQFNVPGIKETFILKPGKVQIVDIPETLLTDGAKCEFSCKKTHFSASSTIVRDIPADKPLEIAVIGIWKNFLPGVIEIPADVPMVLRLYAQAKSPHSDFEIYGTDVKLPFSLKKITSVELPEGLKPGTYPISRPKFPNQNHGIKSKFVVSE
ncbi:MAG: hypothetical protein AB1439_03210 [candidate division FCPU426 bacterium]